MHDLKSQKKYMQLALREAKKALALEEVPIGALIVDETGKVIGRGYNKIESKKCQDAHAEVIAIRKACKKKATWRLNGCWIYVTLEPCLMCLGLIRLSRVEGIFYAAPSPEYGAFTGQQRRGALFSKELIVECGVAAEDSIQLLQSFFNHIRKQRKA